MCNRKILGLVLSVGVLSAWCFIGNLSVSAGGDPPATADLNGDVNGDGARDVSDPLYMLKWMMRGGPAPVALASPQPINAFGRRIAGVYVGVSTHPVVPPLQASWRLNADGTFSSEFVASPGPGGRVLTTHGIWEQTGPRDAVLTQVTFLVDNDTTELDTIFVSRVSGAFNDDFSSFGGTYTLDIFLPGQDATVDAPVATIPGGVFSSSRLALEGE